MAVSWRAYYGTTVAPVSRYRQLDRKQLTRFEILDKPDHVKLSIPLRDGQVLFYRGRAFGLGSKHPQHEIFLVGWRKRLPDGSIDMRLFKVGSDCKVTQYPDFIGECYAPDWYVEEEV